MKFIVKFSLTWLIISHSINLSASEADKEEPRWFEIEVIVFKSTRDDGLFAESWDDKAELTKPEQLIDFLQPYQEEVFPHSQVIDNESATESVEVTEVSKQTPNPVNSAQTDNANLATDSTNLNAGNLDAANISSLSDPGQQDTSIEPTAIEEKPFRTLDASLHQLINEAKSLTRHPNYQVLFHEAWRQPVLGSRQAEHIRIAGGQDFSSQYNYDGSKRIFNDEIDILPSTDDEIKLNQFSDENLNNTNSINDNVTNNDSVNAGSVTNNLATDNLSHNPTDGLATADILNSSDSLSAVEEVKFGNLLPQLVPVPWVPELDGDIKIYLGRYLHIKTNLFLRRPDKEEVEVIDLNMFNSDMLSSFSDDNEFQNDNDFQNTNLELNAINNFQAEQLELTTNDTQTSDNLTPENNIYSFNDTATNTDLQEIQKSQFSWEIDDNFLETESEKMYIERLFNYPVSQSRRVRSGELHFFDHPLVGVLVLITPYEKDKEESEVGQLLAPSM